MKCPRCGKTTWFDVAECSCGWVYPEFASAPRTTKSFMVAPRSESARAALASSVTAENLTHGADLGDLQARAASSEAIERFKRRKMVLRVIDGLWVLGWFLQFPSFKSQWPAAAHWFLWLEAAGSVPVFVLHLWVSRCTVCGGGIKLDGKTCARCGRKLE